MRSEFFEFVKANGLSLKELSQRTGISYARLSRISSGFQRMTDETREAVALALGVPVEAVPRREVAWVSGPQAAGKAG